MASLTDQAAAESTATEVAPLQILATSTCGKFAIGTRSTMARAALYSHAVKDGEDKYRPASALVAIAAAQSATFAGPDGKTVAVW